MPKYTKNDYFAAASCQDLYGATPLSLIECEKLTGANSDLAMDILMDAYHIAELSGDTRIGQDISLLAAQIGCEKAFNKI